MSRFEEFRRGTDWKFVSSALLLVAGTLAAVAVIEAVNGHPAPPPESNLAMSRARLRAIEYRQNMEKEIEAEREGRTIYRGTR
jgi:hypothetical protein